MARLLPHFLIALAALPAAAQSLRVAGEAAAPSTKSTPVAAFKRLGAPASRIQLPALEDAARIRLSEGTLATEKRVQVGISRPLSAGVDLQWQALADGSRSARFDIASPEAGSLRVGLRVRDLPPGTELRFQGSLPGQRVLGPVLAETPLAATRLHGAFWTPLTSGDTQSIEIAIPAGADAGKVRLTVEGASHLATSAERRFAPVVKAAAAACHEDVACAAPGNEALARAAASVAKLVFTENGATYTCTGTLINDGDAASQVPYLYTAAHCVDSAGAAATLNSFWFLEAASCGLKASGNYKQLSGGATLLLRMPPWTPPCCACRSARPTAPGSPAGMRHHLPKAPS